MEDLYQWEGLNRILFNGPKFINLTITIEPEWILLNSKTLFSPNYQNPIEDFDVVKDLIVIGYRWDPRS